MNFEWPVYHGDFYPLTANFPGHTWTGYFTSRPNFKHLIRSFTAISQFSTNYYGLLTLDSIRKKDPTNPMQNLEEFKGHVSELRKMTGKMLHHDSITGTSLIYIIYNETVGMQQLLERNARTMHDLFTT